jgi:hypothetical protein
MEEHQRLQLKRAGGQTFKVILDDADQVTASDEGFTFYIR